MCVRACVRPCVCVWGGGRGLLDGWRGWGGVRVCVLPSTSLWGVYSNSLHPSIITTHTFTD